MAEWTELADFLYGCGFWYADPVKAAAGLSEEQLYWVPDANGLCILWQAGHIAHRERLHLGVFIGGGDPRALLPAELDLFGDEWCSVEELRRSVWSVCSVLDWARQVRQASHDTIDSLRNEDVHAVLPTAADGLSTAHWLSVTACHTALHIGRIQLARAAGGEA